MPEAAEICLALLPTADDVDSDALWQAELQRLRELLFDAGIDVVPHFIIGGRLGLHTPQDFETVRLLGEFVVPVASPDGSREELVAGCD